ncbi:uncharacterized protein LOC123561207 [Mercenaria mercenaria]|uniref:uncharacterized protein LOC123561207 n=1 Tax=Mercenaria mercenaria TaxID=6596 RepID=UPI00234F8642|nr:uncharacterized protein LOC123561207 [Mercenaria mercenaria]
MFYSILQKLDDLLAVFGFNCAVSNHEDNERMFEEENSTDEIIDDIDISVDARVEQYLATPLILTEKENGHDTFPAGDPDDPQNDLEMIQGKMRNGCDCSKYCYNNFSERKILDHVLNLREMERNEKEMYIMGTIGKVTASVRCKDGERKRTRWEYAYEEKKVCRNAFLLIFDIGKRTLEGLLKHE